MYASALTFDSQKHVFLQLASRSYYKWQEENLQDNFFEKEKELFFQEYEGE